MRISLSFEPEILGTGQGFVRNLINQASTDSIVWGTLLLIGGAKLVATALTLGSGGSGGAFMPSLFVGAVLGAAFTDFVAPFWSFSELEPGGFAVVGMAATFAAIARAPLTSILCRLFPAVRRAQMKAPRLGRPLGPPVPSREFAHRWRRTSRSRKTPPSELHRVPPDDPASGQGQQPPEDHPPGPRRPKIRMRRARSPAELRWPSRPRRGEG